MNENKLIKLLDLALERIDYLEAEAIDHPDDALDKRSEVLNQMVKALEEENKELQDYYEKKQKQLEKAIKESTELSNEVSQLKDANEAKEAIIFELNSKLEKVVDQRNKLVLETANAGELGNLKKENENLRETNEKLLRELESAREENEKLIYDTNNSDSVVSLRKENEKLSNRNRQLQADVTLLDDKVRDMMKNAAFTKTKWNDILDSTKRPRPNEPVLITTKSGKIIIGSFEVDGSIRSSGKPTKAKAWMALPKAFE